ncbi:hypothetical protein HZC09_03680 [Candidatus Micrarchaeota archaeon]|nr:hypothetical protein [Candidatus Micrarchaeota archaeon]
MRTINDRNILDAVCTSFCSVLEKHVKYIVVSGFVAISSGRTRGTEDIDVIIERLPSEQFEKLHEALAGAGFECIQGHDPKMLYADYLKDNLGVRYVLKDHLLPEMEVKLAKDILDEYQFERRVKLPLTGLDIWFSSVNANIAFKEELLKSDKDLEDARHLRAVYAEQVDENEVGKLKQLIREWRLR